MVSSEGNRIFRICSMAILGCGSTPKNGVKSIADGVSGELLMNMSAEEIRGLLFGVILGIAVIHSFSSKTSSGPLSLSLRISSFFCFLSTDGIDLEEEVDEEELLRGEEISRAAKG